MDYLTSLIESQVADNTGVDPTLEIKKNALENRMCSKKRFMTLDRISNQELEALTPSQD